LSGAQQLAQPPRNATEAAAETLRALLQPLQQQVDNPAMVALTRDALEMHARRQPSADGASSSSSSSSTAGHSGPTDGAAGLLCQLVLDNSSPQSLAALAKACFSREEQQPTVAAAMAAAVAAVARQLGPQQVSGVLRLLAEHLEPQGLGRESAELADAMQAGFRVLAEGMIVCSEALHPVQLAEAVQVLQQHQYSDPYGLWMLAKEAARRLQELSPADVVAVLHAIAAMRVADDALCGAGGRGCFLPAGGLHRAAAAGRFKLLCCRWGMPGELGLSCCQPCGRTA